MNLIQIASATTLGLFLGMLLFLEVGRRIGLHHLAQEGQLARGIGTADGDVFGLLGLLIAFTFSGAASRFEDRRHLITEEANAIGTAYLRLDLLPATSQAELRTLFYEYTGLRATVYHGRKQHGCRPAEAGKGCRVTKSDMAENAARRACRRCAGPCHDAVGPGTQPDD